MVIVVVLFAIPAVYLLVEFFLFLFTKNRVYHPVIFRFIEFVTMIAYPWFYLQVLDENKNDCCTGSAAFSPAHKATVLLLIALIVLTYFYSSYQKKLCAPVLEVFINAILVAGIVFNVFIAAQIGWLLSLFGNLPVLLLLLFLLIKNQRRFMLENASEDKIPGNKPGLLGWKLLTMKPLLKYPLLFLLFLPLLFIVISLLMLFGQRPDSIIRAFTDTYKHGFSQLDYLCNNVECGGHFLCSVAANGHHKIVKPIRFGERAGGKIICNRQLLISNAFEELMEERLPSLHKLVRRQYNKVGKQIHRHYHFFNNKLVADFVFFMMKPLELFFLFCIYTLDKKPENRIAKQYLAPHDRYQLDLKSTSQ